ncbi:MAG: hypothetical protein AAF348_01290, partial [Bacteroidota bacterium]
PQWPLDFKSNVSTNSTTRAFRLTVLNGQQCCNIKCLPPDSYRDHHSSLCSDFYKKTPPL